MVIMALIVLMVSVYSATVPANILNPVIDTSIVAPTVPKNIQPLDVQPIEPSGDGVDTKDSEPIVPANVGDLNSPVDVDSLRNPVLNVPVDVGGLGRTPPKQCNLDVTPDEVVVRAGGTVVLKSNLAGVTWKAEVSDNIVPSPDGTLLYYHAPKKLGGSQLYDHVTASKGGCYDVSVIKVVAYKVDHIDIDGPNEVEAKSDGHSRSKVSSNVGHYVVTLEDEYGNPVEGIGVYVDLVPYDVDGAPDSELDAGADEGWSLHLVADENGQAEFDLVAGYSLGVYSIDVADADNSAEAHMKVVIVPATNDDNNTGGDDNNGGNTTGGDDNNGTVTGGSSSGGSGSGSNGITGRGGIYFVNVTSSSPEEPVVNETEPEPQPPEDVAPMNVIVKYPTSVYVGDDIVVEVRDAYGKAISGRMVTFVDPMGNEFSKITDINGKVSTIALKKGVYSIKVDGAQGTLRVRANEKPVEEAPKNEGGLFGMVGAIFGEDKVMPVLALMGLLLLAVIGAGIYYLSQGDVLDDEGDFGDEFGETPPEEVPGDEELPLEDESEEMKEMDDSVDVIDLSEEGDEDEKL